MNSQSYCNINLFIPLRYYITTLGPSPGITGHPIGRTEHSLNSTWPKLTQLNSIRSVGRRSVGRSVAWSVGRSVARSLGRSVARFVVGPLGPLWAPPMGPFSRKIFCGFAAKSFSAFTTVGAPWPPPHGAPYELSGPIGPHTSSRVPWGPSSQIVIFFSNIFF